MSGQVCAMILFILCYCLEPGPAGCCADEVTLLSEHAYNRHVHLYSFIRISLPLLFLLC